jgi:hypothetical protein
VDWVAAHANGCLVPKATGGCEEVWSLLVLHQRLLELHEIGCEFVFDGIFPEPNLGASARPFGVVYPATTVGHNTALAISLRSGMILILLKVLDRVKVGWALNLRLLEAE